jgi:hypothetical protein
LVYLLFLLDMFWICFCGVNEYLFGVKEYLIVYFYWFNDILIVCWDFWELVVWELNDANE